MPAQDNDPALLPHVPRRHVGRAVAAVVLVLALLLLVQSLAVNQALDWPTVWKFFANYDVLAGLGRTLLITAIAIVVAVILGGLLATMRLSENRVLRGIAWIYVWFFRSVPLLVLLILTFNLSLLWPTISIGIPFGPTFYSVETQDLINPFVAAVVTFSLQQAAYTSEVLRASIQSVPTGQREAAIALGMTRTRTMLRIVFPQAFRVALPPIGNDTINLLKSTSLVAFIAVPDLMYSVQQIYSANFLIIPLLVVATIWYMIVVSVLSVGQSLLERRLRNSPARQGRQKPPGLATQESSPTAVNPLAADRSELTK
ncbi:amino acid ABC transporter permease [Subtercola endophyticus]|uniref:amino acid ABC transporter permease n=1 Tax=Subtercola endophyticus TaxID=2895559 RepID=UPI001E284F5B|nr:amino acid ABC transporter permease [Subtercola endophyticus]UFS57623.1 amino acid ABC transporter permease [Subtercola endophyticus]